MKNIIFVLLIFSLTNLLGQKKDLQAWKAEKTIEAQFEVFKANLSNWDGYYMTKAAPINEFHKSLADTVAVLEKQIANKSKEITALKNNINELTSKLEETKNSLDQSLVNERSLMTLGIQFDKDAFPGIMYGIISLLIITSRYYSGLYYEMSTM